MSTQPLWGGRLFIADKSVWDRADRPEIAPLWTQALVDRQIVTCAINRMETETTLNRALAKIGLQRIKR